ncbi:hypothetical protein C8J56DRAFT_1063956 [Mycena floridula]|nr:hypothetical protein C8J56DRAFT_1063956 [Mycena floridula]
MGRKAASKAQKPATDHDASSEDYADDSGLFTNEMYKITQDAEAKAAADAQKVAATKASRPAAMTKPSRQVAATKASRPAAGPAPAPVAAPGAAPAPAAPKPYAFRHTIIATPNVSPGIEQAILNRKQLAPLQPGADITPTRSQRAASQRSLQSDSVAGPSLGPRSLSRASLCSSPPNDENPHPLGQDLLRGRSPFRDYAHMHTMPPQTPGRQGTFENFSRQGSLDPSFRHGSFNNISRQGSMDPFLHHGSFDQLGRQGSSEQFNFPPNPYQGGPGMAPAFNYPWGPAPPGNQQWAPSNPAPPPAPPPAPASTIEPSVSGTDLQSLEGFDPDSNLDDDDDDTTKENKEPRRRGRMSNAAKAGLEESLKKMDALALACGKEYGFAPELIQARWLPRINGPTTWNDAQTFLKIEENRIEYIPRYIPGTKPTLKQVSSGYTKICEKFGEATGEYLRLQVEDIKLDEPQSCQNRQRLFRSGFAGLTRTAEHLNTMTGMNVLLFAVGDTVEEDHSNSLHYVSPGLQSFVDQFMIVSPPEFLSYMKSSLFQTVAFDHLVAKIRQFLAKVEADKTPKPVASSTNTSSIVSTEGAPKRLTSAAAGDKIFISELRTRLQGMASKVGLNWPANVVPWAEMIDKNAEHGVQIRGYPYGVPLPGMKEKILMTKAFDHEQYPLCFVKVNGDDLRNGKIPYLIHGPPPADHPHTHAQRLFHSKERPHDFEGPAPRSTSNAVKPRHRVSGKAQDNFLEEVDETLDHEDFDSSTDNDEELSRTRTHPVVTRSTAAKVKQETESALTSGVESQDGQGDSSESSKRSRDPTSTEEPSSKRARRSQDAATRSPDPAASPSGLPAAAPSTPVLTDSTTSAVLASSTPAPSVNPAQSIPPAWYGYPHPQQYPGAFNGHYPQQNFAPAGYGQPNHYSQSGSTATPVHDQQQFAQHGPGGFGQHPHPQQPPFYGHPYPPYGNSAYPQQSAYPPPNYPPPGHGSHFPGPSGAPSKPAPGAA